VLASANRDGRRSSRDAVGRRSEVAARSRARAAGRGKIMIGDDGRGFPAASRPRASRGTNSAYSQWEQPAKKRAGDPYRSRSKGDAFEVPAGAKLTAEQIEGVTRPASSTSTSTAPRHAGWRDPRPVEVAQAGPGWSGAAPRSAKRPHDRGVSASNTGGVDRVGHASRKEGRLVRSHSGCPGADVETSSESASLRRAGGWFAP